jgi:hypothetical protein
MSKSLHSESHLLLEAPHLPIWPLVSSFMVLSIQAGHGHDSEPLKSLKGKKQEGARLSRKRSGVLNRSK